jgi:hypothetical protein
LFSTLAAASHDNIVTPPAEIFHESFMGDATPEAAALVYSTLRAQQIATLPSSFAGPE